MGEPSREAERGEADELARVTRVYGDYARSARRRRAWAADNPGNAAIRAELARACWELVGAELAEGELLDAGCGTGFWLRWLLDSGVPPERLHGIDLLPERLAAARAALPGAVQLRQGDVRRMPYPSGAFDAVLLFTVLSSLRALPDVRAVLREASRVTRPGGTVLIYEARYPNPLNRHTLWIRPRVVGDALEPVDERPLTVWPPLARRLGRATGRIYARLEGMRWSTSHRLLAYRRP